MIKMSYESEFDKPIGNIAKREFQDNEFKVGHRQGQFMMAGQTKKKDIKDHFKKAKEVFK